MLYPELYRRQISRLFSLRKSTEEQASILAEEQTKYLEVGEVVIKEVLSLSPTRDVRSGQRNITAFLLVSNLQIDERCYDQIFSLGMQAPLDSDGTIFDFEPNQSLKILRPAGGMVTDLFIETNIGKIKLPISPSK